VAAVLLLRENIESVEKVRMHREERERRSERGAANMTRKERSYELSTKLVCTAKQECYDVNAGRAQSMKLRADACSTTLV